MRIPFSFFLMPIYWFSLSQVGNLDVWVAIHTFLVLHLLIYPASNGYNSYMDKDTDSIGGLEKPPMPTQGLLYLTIIFDVIGLLLAAIIGFTFFLMVLIYILVSKAYSYHPIRLKKYPIISFLTVAWFQGGFTYLMVHAAFEKPLDLTLLFQPYAVIAASLMIAGVYPLTQIYQHKQDKESGDNTISLLLGKKGTLITSSIFFMLSGIAIYFHFQSNHVSYQFWIFQLCMCPVVIYFGWWAWKIFSNEQEANFSNTMRMNVVASSAMSACFILLMILNF